MDEIKLQEAYLSLVDDADFDRLELALGEPNIFSILSIEQMEIRHSNFLAWLLDPAENHGLNDLFIKRFLRQISIDQKLTNIQPLDAEMLDYQQVEVLREWRSIDILVKFKNLVICIENKVRSKDHSKQLSRYREIVESEFPDPNVRKAYLYLTLYGEASSEEQKNYAFVAYQTVVDILDRFLMVYKDKISPKTCLYIQDYNSALKRNFMKSDQANDLAKNIYLNHRKILDFIFENRPDLYDDFSRVLTEAIKSRGFRIGSKNKGFVRFLSEPLVDLVPCYPSYNGWPNKEAFLFEFDFYNLKKKSLTFRAVSSPASSNKNYKERFAEIIKELGDTRSSLGEKWESYYMVEIKMDIEELLTGPIEELDKKLHNAIERVMPIINKVEGKLLDHKVELIRLKEEVGK